MDKRRRERYRKKLEQKQCELQALVLCTGEAGRATDIDFSKDSAERAANSYAKEFLFRQSDAERTQLQLVQQALSRIASVDFGLCQSCDEIIDKKRLDAVPWTRFCRDCQEAEEHRRFDPQEIEL
ncbi:MAG: TraR/DksA C4-type zinc finger protein [Bryobacterales bacterium]|nr:TraR/DksA C4-type zinc finger protein [Bryobacterales bacterium]